ncbi:MAG TPA: acyl-CoA thioester hydrolase/BAAT C-terminal domain-containing protein, partial [Bryobacteraceae bacterium]|nr:acyl-CoA thioester hydrolase/BAAT C-terminal domain-containing protein [Bryobacteraceae bacterium]
EFLEEAVVLARSGAVSLLIDAPYVRPGFVLERELMRAAEQSARVEQQEVVDLRRGTDLLLARPDVDPKRIAYVGHSFGAHAGALLAGVDKRIQSFVLMAGSYADQENAFDLNTPEMQQVRAQMGEDRLRQFFSQHSWDDPVYYAPHSSPAAVFLQFASKDQSDDRARQYYGRFGNPKQMKIYMAAHALNAAARMDRVEWLARRLSLRAVDRTALEKIPPL